MEEWQLHSLIRQMIREEITQTFMGKIVSVEEKYRATAQRFSSEPPLAKMRLIQPYGLASNPTPEMECVISPIGGDATHLNVTGFNDDKRPVTATGEVCLYGADGQVVFLKTGGMVLMGSQAASEPAVLGNVMKAALTDLYTEVKALAEAIKSGPVAIATAPGGLCPTAPALITAATQTSSKMDSQKSKYVETADSNIVARKIFVERGTE